MTSSEPAKLRTLVLLRHAKSGWIDDSTDDFYRPLAKRGLNAAPRMGAFIARQNLTPTLALCSSAARARQTLALVVPELSTPPATEYRRDFYLADPDTLLTALQNISVDVDCALLVGHNPEVHELAAELTKSGEREDIAALSEKFPTAAVAILSFRAASWRQLQFASCHLSAFMTPKLLA